MVLAVGTELGETDYDVGFDGGFKIQGQLIRVDIDASQCHSNIMPNVAINADAGQALLALCDEVEPTDVDAEWGIQRAQQACLEARAELNQRDQSLALLIDQIARRLPNAIFVGDSTQPVYAGNLSYNADAPRQWFNSSTGYGTLGYALPAAIGAQLATQARPVVALIGDGGLLFTLSELATAVDASLPLIVIIWNNQGFGEIRRAMQDRGVAKTAVDFATPDFIQIAKAFRCHGARVQNPVELDYALSRSMKRMAPTVIEISETAWFAATNVGAVI